MESVIFIAEQIGYVSSQLWNTNTPIDGVTWGMVLFGLLMFSFLVGFLIKLNNTQLNSIARHGFADKVPKPSKGGKK